MTISLAFTKLYFFHLEIKALNIWSYGKTDVKYYASPKDDLYTFSDTDKHTLIL